jgi:hypothetical protein
MTDTTVTPSPGDRVRVVSVGPHEGCEGVLHELGPFAHSVLLDKDAPDADGVRFFRPVELEWYPPEVAAGTETAGHIVDAGHMPRLADLNDDTSPYPAQIGIFCDDCHTEHLADYLVAADSTREQRFEVAREHLRGLGWSCTEAGDLCPDCAKPVTP